MTKRFALHYKIGSQRADYTKYGTTGSDANGHWIEDVARTAARQPGQNVDDEETDEWLFKNNIIYSPDYLVNSGGVIAIASEVNKTQDLLEKQLSEISDRLELVLQESIKNKVSTDSVAKRIAMERINNSNNLNN